MARRSYVIASCVVVVAVGGVFVACGGSDASDTPPVVVAPDGTIDDGSDIPEVSKPETPKPIEGIVVRPSGKVVNVQDGVPCGAGIPASAVCKHVTVQCPGVAELGATIAVIDPEADGGADAGAPSATVLGFSGGGGDSYYNVGVAQIVAKGTYRVVLPKWDGEWEASNDGILGAACRPATLVSWIFDNLHTSSRTKAFCAAGFSGGSGAISYALAHYGRKDVLDYVALAAGPPFGRLDYGCAPASYAGPPRVLCPLLKDAVVPLPGPTIDKWENTKTCGAASPSIDDILKWGTDGVVSPGADYDYPKTSVDFFDCTNMPNGTTGGAFFYSSAIASTHAVYCFDGANDACSGEGLGKGAGVLVDQLVAKCVPRH
jgi:hypothetical protein